jgi:hypothetical protein
MGLQKANEKIARNALVKREKHEEGIREYEATVREITDKLEEKVRYALSWGIGNLLTRAYTVLPISGPCRESRDQGRARGGRSGHQEEVRHPEEGRLSRDHRHQGRARNVGERRGPLQPTFQGDSD